MEGGGVGVLKGDVGKCDFLLVKVGVLCLRMVLCVFEVILGVIFLLGVFGLCLRWWIVGIRMWFVKEFL